MGHIFNINTARLYEIWRRSPQGRLMERSAGQFMTLLLEPQPGEKILDIGCGSGNHLLLYRRLGLDMTGVDASSIMLDKARERLGDRCLLKKGLAEDLPFDDNEFDLATLINTLEFVENPLKVLQEAGRVAKRGVFVGVINSLSWYCFRSKAQGLWRDTLFDQARPYNLWELKSYLRSALGPVPLEWRSSSFWPWFLDQFHFIFPKTMNPNHWPLGSFLGVAAKILYVIKTDNLTLKIDIKKAGQTVPSGVTMEQVLRGVNQF